MKVLLSSAIVFVFPFLPVVAESPTAAAPAQANAKSTSGAPSSKGTNGTAISGQSMTKAPAKKKKNSTAVPAAPATTAMAAQPAPAKPVPVKPPASVLDNYLKDLGDTLQLTADEQKQIRGYYAADAAQLKNIFNDSTLSPLQQAQQVSDLRDRRDDKIEMLLNDPGRRRNFFALEARYRVALVEAAAK
jgi:hypothetical protein